jgi:hypothetical protein
MDTVSIVGAGAVFIDDIVLPDGVTHMDTLGGGTIHALLGSVIWGERAGVSAFIGYNLSPQSRNFLNAHLDTAGLVELDIPQARAWQLFEYDGTRREVSRVKNSLPFNIGTTVKDLPESYKQVNGYYLLQNFETIHEWTPLDGLKLWEPHQFAMMAGDKEAFQNVLKNCPVDVVSPNLAESQAIYGDYPAEDLIKMMFDDGAKVVAMRMGRDGSIVASREDGVLHCIGIIPDVAVVDETGAGNTYNGGFLAGMVQGRSWVECGMMGAVSASFCIERVGVVNPQEINHAERDRRFNLLSL